MQGHVYLDATQLEDEETGITVDCELKDVGVVDKFKLLESLCKALQISKQECLRYVLFLNTEA